MRTFAIVTLSLLPLVAPIAYAEPKHAISMHGQPALAPDYTHLPYANPAAPVGGRIVLGELGSFDSLNPFILKGTAPWALRGHVFESLLGRNWDEPFSLYGLLAETVETDSDRSWVEFTLRESARFSDGTPVTVEDVIFSMETLAEKGNPNYANSWSRVATVEQTGPRQVRFTFKAPDRELPLILGLRPILKAADWAAIAFEESSLRVPVGSGPYPVSNFEPGRFMSFKRNPDYWGRMLPFNAGRHNLDEIRYEFFRDGAAQFEAFRAGTLSFFREGDPDQWRDAYSFAAARDGRVVKAAIPHQRPSGMKGLVFNTRRAVFSDRKVRKALTLAFNFGFINARLNQGMFKRIASYYSNTRLGIDGPATESERSLLGPYLDHLPPDVLDDHVLPEGATRPVDRKALRQARGLLGEAGWEVSDGVLKNAEGAVFRFEILLRATDDQAVVAIYAEALKALGIEVTTRLADSAQYNLLRTDYDFDMIVNRWALSLSPGHEQTFYWGSRGRDVAGTRNYMGVAEPAIDAMIDTMLTTRDQETFVGAVRSLDRLLVNGYYVIPYWFATESWVAHDARLEYPERIPLYGDWPGFLPDVWWMAR